MQFNHRYHVHGNRRDKDSSNAHAVFFARGRMIARENRHYPPSPVG